MIATEIVDVDYATLVPNTSCHHDQQPEPQLPTRLSHTDVEEKVPAEVVEDISGQEDSPHTIPQARPMSKKRPSTTASTPSLKNSNKKARVALEMAKVQEKGEDVPIIKAKDGISQSKGLTDLAMIIDSQCSDMGPKGAEDHAVLSHDISRTVLGHDSLPSNSTQPAETLQIEVQSRFFLNVSETIVETTIASELEPAPAQPPVTEPEHTLDVASDTTLHLPSDPELDPVPEPGHHRVPKHASESKSEAQDEQLILEQDPVPEPKDELGPVQDDPRSSSKPLELATEVKPRLDKGKGRAIELEEVVRKDFTRIPVVDDDMTRKTYVVPLSERQTNVPTSPVVPSVPLTVARKRDLLKKRQPLPVQRNVE